ncbi:MAG TPA: RdgB/HAM1 family non-canonical purine NTP pyrophosphatase [Planctomycetota bacterium]|nr:RdgB/HAM1 family non-canonical purine NTP pyrophosphatase [Planctomycetota bacterium]
MRTVVIGTGNKHKVQEISPLLSGLPITLKAAGEYGPFDPVEDGSTLEENAIIKAKAALKLSGEWSISDDTGLYIDALDGRPGIYAARYAGEGCSFADNINKVLREMQGVPLEKRIAKFACVIALCRTGCEPVTFRGECSGWIRTEPRGGGGFGYDPIFVISGLEKTFAELTAQEKNTVSHRSIATKLCRAALEKLLRS